MEWHDIRDPNDPELDRLAERYSLHHLHIEDCRHRNQNAKVEEDEGYLFVVVKPVEVTADGQLEVSDLDLFVGRDFLVTVTEGEAVRVRGLLDHLRGTYAGLRPDQLLYRIADMVVDTYQAILDHFDDLLDGLEDQVLEKPTPDTLARIFEAKRGLIELRRVLGNMRDVSAHLQRTESPLIGHDLWPFLRDLYDHLARALDTVEVQRDLLTGALDIYMSSVANRTNQVMKALTVLGTIALPVLVVSSFYGMNLEGLPGAESPYGTLIASALMAGMTVILLLVLRLFRWI
jgi:magnesium transporter